jgi:hypothetical protein
MNDIGRAGYCKGISERRGAERGLKIGCFTLQGILSGKLPCLDSPGLEVKPGVSGWFPLACPVPDHAAVETSDHDDEVPHKQMFECHDPTPRLTFL